MTDFDSLKIIDFDHLEFAVGDLDRYNDLYLRLGFEKVASREILERKLRSHLFVQNHIYLVLSHSDDSNDFVARYHAAHGDGVCNVAFRCENAHSAFELTVNRGAEVAVSPKAYKKDFGAVEQAAIKAFGDVRHTFVSREGSLFAEGFETPLRVKTGGFGLKRIDHITTNVEKERIANWADFYKRVFGFINTRFFDIRTERTGLYSYVLQSPNGIIKMPFNEPTEGASQIQEFIDIHHGPGVQHVALETDEIMPSLRLLKREGVQFLEAPPRTYYETLQERLPTLTESVRELEDLALLADGDKKGYLLQLFTQNVTGPFFYEIIQRKGNDGFGEGNFKALFEAIERDQIRRGVLNP